MWNKKNWRGCVGVEKEILILMKPSMPHISRVATQAFFKKQIDLKSIWDMLKYA